MNESWNDLVPPASGLAAHLGDIELSAVELAPSAEKHLADCAWCRQRRQTMSQDDREELASLLRELDHVDVPPGTVEAASTWSLPGALADALHSNSADWPDVAPTQLWRLSWRGEDALAVVLDCDAWWVRVAPLTSDIALADEYTYIADRASTALSQPAAIFMRATATVPLYTLSWFLGDVAPNAHLDVQDALRRLEVACIQQSAPPSDVPTGALLTADAWDRLEALEALNEQMRWFEAATHGVIDELGPVAGREVATDEIAVEVSELLKRRGVEFRQLVVDTGLPPGRLLDLKAGRVQPSFDELMVLTKLFGVPVRGGGHTENERLAIFEVLCQPPNRGYWFAWNAAHGARAPEDSLVPYVEHLLDNPIAARSVTTPTATGQDLSRDEWRQVWRDRFAMRRHGRAEPR